MVIARTTFESQLEGNEVEFTSQAELAAMRAQRAQEQALAQAGVTQRSGFAEAAPAPIAAPEPPPAPVVDPSTPTVRASQLANGTASLAAEAEPEAASGPLLFESAGADLATIMSGKDGSTPLTRDQVVQTVLDALPADAQGAASALLHSELGVTDESLASAFNQVIEARKSPGQHTLSFELEAKGAWRSNRDPSEGAYRGDGERPVFAQEELAPTSFSATVTVDNEGRVNGKALAADVATVADYKPYPDGNSADHVKAQFDVVGDPGNLATLTAARGDQPALPRQAVIDTVLEAAPEARALIAAGVTDDSLARAFSQVIEARKTPGEKSLSLNLVGFEPHTEWGGNGEYPVEITTMVPAANATTFAGKMSVSAEGLVNGARLSADIATQITSAARNVPQEFKDATLKEVGLSDEWMGNATQETKDYALAKIINAKDTPGAKQLDFSYGYSVIQYNSESPVPTDLVAAGVVNLNVGADGLVNGKPLTAEIAFNSTRTVEAMPAAVRRATLMSLGFTEDAINKGSPDQEKCALIKTSVATATPGDARFEVHMGGDKCSVGLKIGEDGSIDGAGVALVPPPPKKSWWKTVVSVVLTVVSIVYPPVAIICQAIQAGMAIASGAKGLALVGAIAGAAAGFADVAGYASMASTLSTVATTVGTVNSAINAFKSGDFLGALSSAASLAGGFAGGELGETLSTIGTVAAGVRAAKSGDIAGALGAGLSVASGLTGGETAETLKTLGQVATTVSHVVNGDIEGALTGVLDLAGLRGALVPKSEPTAPTVTPVVDGALGADNSLTLAGLTLPVTFGGTGFGLGFDLSNIGNTLGYAFDGDVGGVLGSVLETEQGPQATQADVRRIDNAIPLPTSRVVAPGENLSKIAAEMMGDANRWPELYAYNVKALGGASANSIRAGTELLIPPPEFELPSSTRNAMHNAAHIEPPPPRAEPAGSGLQVIEAPTGFNINLGSSAASFASGLAGTDLPGTVLGGTALGAIVDQSIAYGKSLPKAALPAGTDSWAGYAKQFGSNMVNTLANSVLLAGDALFNFMPGSDSNRAVMGAVSDFGTKVSEIATTVWNDNGAGAAKALEKAIGTAVFTVMDPRQWGEGGTKLFETVISATFGGTAKLAETMNRDPGSIEPGKLMLDAMHAAAGLSSLLLVGAAKNAVVGAADDVVAGVTLGLEGRVVGAADNVIDSVPRVFAPTAEQLARVEAAVLRTEPPVGHYTPMKPEVRNFGNAETLTAAEKAGFEGVADFMWDVARPITRTQELDNLVAQRAASNGISNAQALEIELAAMESRAGFKRVIDLEARSYTDTEFAQMLAEGALFRDTAFANSVHHGVQTHRVQWWGVARDMELHPERYGNTRPVDLYRSIGTANVGAGPAAMWARLFDTAVDYHPSFGGFYLRHQDLFPHLAGGL